MGVAKRLMEKRSYKQTATSVPRNIRTEKPSSSFVSRLQNSGKTHRLRLNSVKKNREVEVVEYLLFSGRKVDC